MFPLTVETLSDDAVYVSSRPENRKGRTTPRFYSPSCGEDVAFVFLDLPVLIPENVDPFPASPLFTFAAENMRRVAE